MEPGQIDVVRRFNRAVTRRVGALSDEYLSRDRSLGLSRLLWEVEPDGSEVRVLRSRLALDSGYLSRQLRRLESDGLVTTDPDSDDGRVRKVRLTEAGVAERATLDLASDELAASILDPLTDGQRGHLVAAMTEVERLLLASQVRIEITDPRAPDARYCLRSYFEELQRRFDTGFNPTRSISASDDEMTLPNGLLLVATAQGTPVGCGALKLHAETRIADVKRMWTSPDTRGLGLGRRILERLADEATTRGMQTLRLETNRTLTEARHLYETAGFTQIEAFNDEQYAHHWFERNLER
ncbi:bifunctional helix-turn-helix transcriptional regulator/GNAT family N-acetyltransferase [Actinacidiphila glaucinigra]|uniref:Transcriptional regulator, MarR family with acetyltransferase activity n=1 Tax=Actinacidiphila glaucinigra TaxID=235986 RepID=A0A238ZJJ7_9ACTN|nr:bifunctional helix-turn-helix transcriptional regulator/GNAT family N-acetyltransferase [Actinacidiphila glaucinigra]SNR83636.1 transcriptional regulator, MarR family with acetyltransferase activity [Actinacidiphila glaucinigra]